MGEPGRKWVLSQEAEYALCGGCLVRLPRVVCVSRSRQIILARLEARAVECFGEYDEKRLVVDGVESLSYPPPQGCSFEQAGGAIAVVRVAEDVSA